MTNSLPSKPQKRNNDFLSSGLKVALVIGSLIASIVGARLVALKDAAAGTVTTKPTVVIYATPPAQPAMPDATGSGAPRTQPVIPTVIAPAPVPVNPVTSTHSSR